MKKKLKKYKAILDDIQKDLSDYQNEIGIGMIDDNEWADLFIERVAASIESYAELELTENYGKHYKK